MQPGYVKNTKDMETHFLLMRFSSRLMASNVTFGERSGPVIMACAAGLFSPNFFGCGPIPVSP